MGRDWYEAQAHRFGGYRKLWDSVIEGEDGEAAFTAFLRQTIRPHHRVLDVGCGDGLYTLHVSALAEHVTGIDFAPAMVAMARRNQQSAAIPNVSFVCGSTSGGAELPFADGSFDLIYSRRGPGSHLDTCRRLLRPGGLVVGIHTGARDEIIQRIAAADVPPCPTGGYRVPRWWFIWVGAPNNSVTGGPPLCRSISFAMDTISTASGAAGRSSASAPRGGHRPGRWRPGSSRKSGPSTRC